MLMASAALLCCVDAVAIDLAVEPRQVSVDESVRVTLMLDGDAAKLDSVDLPLKNLESSGPPSTSSQFTIVNGVMSRKKTFTWWVSPIEPGSATVGPLQIATPDGGLVLVPSVAVQVLAAPDADATTPSEALEKLYLSGRDEVVLVAEATPSNAVVGQEVIVTWTLYSAVSLRGFAISSIPELDSFWVEEDLVEDRRPRSARIGGHVVQRMSVRRASLFPLRDGQLEIPPLEVRVEVIRPFRDPFGGFSLTEGRVAEVRRRSGPISVSVSPAAVAADAVGRFRMNRSEPVVSPEGLVTFDVTVEGAGSLRSMPAPRLITPVEGEVEVQEAGSDVIGRSPLRMRRVWRYVIFPRASGSLRIPSLETRTYVPGTTSAKVLRTEPVAVGVVLSGGAEPRGEANEARDDAAWRLSTSLAGVILLLVVAALAGVMRFHRVRSNVEYQRIVSAVGHTITLRKRLEEAVTMRGADAVALYSESSELGDAWRAAMSLVDRIEKEPESIDDREREIRARARRLLDELERIGDHTSV